MLASGAIRSASGRQLLEAREHITTLQLSTDDATPLRVDAVNLKDRLCNVEADRRNCLHDVLLQIVAASSATDSKALARPVGGARIDSPKCKTRFRR
jgi:hypothetical protein